MRIKLKHINDLKEFCDFESFTSYAKARIEIMETSQNLVSLFSQLRNQDCKNADVVSQEIFEIYKDVDSFSSLIYIATNSDDKVLSAYALLGISQLVKMHAMSLNEEQLRIIKENVFSLLQNYASNLDKQILILVLVDILHIMKGNWAELYYYIHTEEHSPQLVLALILEMISFMETRTISIHTSFYVQLISDSLKEYIPDQNIPAITLFYKLHFHLENKAVLEPLLPIVFNNFLSVLNKYDEHCLQNYIHCANAANSRGLVVMHLSPVGEEIFAVLESESAPVTFKYMVNTFLQLYIGMDVLYSVDQVILFFDLECKLFTQFCKFNSEDFQLLWVVDANIIIESILVNFNPDQVFTICSSVFNQYIASPDPAYRFVGLLIISSAISFSYRLSDMIPTIININLSCLNDPDKYVQIISCFTLETIAKSYSSLLNIYLPEVVMALMSSDDPEVAHHKTEVLANIIGTLKSSDSIFSELIPIAFQLLESENDFIKTDAISILKHLILTSEQEVISSFDILYNNLITFLTHNFIYSDLFSVIGALSIKCPNRIAQHSETIINVFRSYVEHGESCDKYYAMCGILTFIEAIHEGDNSSEYYLQTLYSQLQPFADYELSKQVGDDAFSHLTGSKAVEVLSKICLTSTTNDYIPIIISLITIVLNTDNYYCILLGCNALDLLSLKYKNCFETLNPNDLTILIDQLKEIIKSNTTVSIDCMDKMINTISNCVMNCGVEILGENEVEFIQIMTNVFPYLYVSDCDTIQLDIILKSFICLTSTLIQNSNLQNRRELVFSLLSFSYAIVTSNAMREEYFAFQLLDAIYTNEMVVDLIPTHSQIRFCKIMEKIIKEEDPIIAQEAALVVSHVAKEETYQAVISEQSFNLVNILANRIETLTEKTVSNARFLESIVIAICTLAPNLENDFPCSLIPSLFSVLPISRIISDSQDVYAFLIAIFPNLGSSYIFEYLRVFVTILAVPFPHLLKTNLDLVILSSMALIVNQCLNSVNDIDHTISDLLDNDEYRIANFQTNYDQLSHVDMNEINSFEHNQKT